MTTLIVSTLNTSEAEKLTDLSPEADWGIHEAGLICVDEGTFPDKITFVGLDELGLLDDLPDQEEGRDDDLHRIVGPEGLDIPWLVGGVSVQDGDEDHPDKADVGASGLQPGVVGELAAVQVLSFACPVEENICYTDGDVVDQT